MAETKSYFHLFDWSHKSPDPNDVLMGQLVSDPLDLKRLDTCDTVIFGIPFDDAVLGRKGSAEGPRAIRDIFQNLKAEMYAGGEVQRTVYDLGDFMFSTGDVEGAHEQVEKAARHARTFAARPKRKGRRPHARVIALGGDHSLTYPCAIPYLQQYGKNFAVINLDAHLDVRTVAEGEMQNSGTSFGRLLDAGLSSYTVIGARDFHTTSKYVKRVRDAGGRIVTTGEVFSRGAQAVAREALEKLPAGCTAVYLSVDIDVADASVAPGVSAPTPGGLLAHQIYELVQTLANDERVIACDIMELAPPLEDSFSDRSARLAAGCLAYMVSSS